MIQHTGVREGLRTCVPCRDAASFPTVLEEEEEEEEEEKEERGSFTVPK